MREKHIRKYLKTRCEENTQNKIILYTIISGLTNNFLLISRFAGEATKYASPTIICNDNIHM